MKKRLIGLLIAGVVTSSMLLGCGGSDYSSREMAASESFYSDYAYDDVYMSKNEAEYAEMPMEAATEESSYAGNNGAKTENVEAKDTSRKIIKTVNLNVETEEFDKLLANVKNKVETMGGYLESTNISGRSLYANGKEKRYASITARVPSNKLEEFINNISENSNVTNKSESAQDVTLNYADTKAHIDSLRIEQERLDELLKEAQDIETIVVLEDKRTSVRYEIESYESQLRTFDNKIDYSTVYLDVSEVVEYTIDPEEKIPFLKKISEGFSKSFADVAETVVDSIADFIINIPYILLSIVSFIIGLCIFCIVIFVIIKAISIATRFATKKKAKSGENNNKDKKVLKQASKKNKSVPTDRKKNKDIIYTIEKEKNTKENTEVLSANVTEGDSSEEKTALDVLADADNNDTGYSKKSHYYRKNSGKRFYNNKKNKDQ